MTKEFLMHKYIYSLQFKCSYQWEEKDINFCNEYPFNTVYLFYCTIFTIHNCLRKTNVMWMSLAVVVHLCYFPNSRAFPLHLSDLYPLAQLTAQTIPHVLYTEFKKKIIINYRNFSLQCSYFSFNYGRFRCSSIEQEVFLCHVRITDGRHCTKNKNT